MTKFLLKFLVIVVLLAGPFYAYGLEGSDLRAPGGDPSDDGNRIIRTPDGQILRLAEEKREAAKKLMEARQEEIRKNLHNRLQSVKDQRKKNTVERIQASLDALNQRMTNHFTNVLDRLEKILQRIAAREEKAELRGLDTSTVETAIDAAEIAIATARSAVAAQAGKIYPIIVTDEAHLRDAAKTAREALHDDIKKVFDAVKAAKEAVRKAATALAKIPRVDEGSNGNATSTINN